MEFLTRARPLTFESSLRIVSVYEAHICICTHTDTETHAPAHTHTHACMLHAYSQKLGLVDAGSKPGRRNQSRVSRRPWAELCVQWPRIVL